MWKIHACKKFTREKISDEKKLHVKKISDEKKLHVKKISDEKNFGKKFFRAKKKLLFFTVISTKPRVMSSQSISGKCPKVYESRTCFDLVSPDCSTTTALSILIK